LGKNGDTGGTSQPVPGGRWSTSPENQAKARKFFEHAKKSAETRNYDYAVQLYCEGLAFWPDAVEEGLKPLRVVATARRLEGGKGAGFMAGRKLATTGKDVLKALSNAMHLYGLDPSNVAHMEEILRLAARAGCDRVVHWIAPVIMDAFNSGKKLPPTHYQEACANMDTGAELAIRSGDDQIAMEILNAAIATSQIWNQQHPDSTDAPRARSNATGKLTILKGKFDKQGGYEESLKDREGQRDLHDRDKAVHTVDRNAELVARARAEWEANRQVPAKLLAVADLMIRIENEETENQAIALLEEEYKTNANYVFKMKADDIRMRQFNRRRRELTEKAKEAPHDAAARNALAAHASAQTEAEIAIFQDRLTHYPTEARIRFQLATRYFVSRRFDDAIPLFQQALADGRFRGESRLYIGRCFYEKGFSDQAIQTLRGAASDLDSTTSTTALETSYWLGRALEKSNQASDARKVFGDLIQLDYNYRDARHRLEKLTAAS
jgi:TolA-binding protein